MILPDGTGEGISPVFELFQCLNGRRHLLTGWLKRSLYQELDLPKVFQFLALSLPISSLLKFGIVSALTILFSYLVSRFVVRKSVKVTVLGLVLLFITAYLFIR